MTAPAIRRTRRVERVTVRRHIDPGRPQLRGIRVGVRWPIGIDEAIRAEATGYLPLPITKLIQQAEARGYTRGKLETLQRAAGNLGELDLLGDGWRERSIDTAAERRRQQRAADEERALFANRQRNIAAGRHPDWVYLGQSRGGSGAVDWETGYPVETVEAWKRRQSLTVVEGAA
ncbi:hypothetical protein [Dactylosporangium salmoneum]|uniref:Uncharacterized protein n=1 Tax=Dactylosporangium salmoneum TaxID=53361 RepID=A0ABN3G8Y0_9ACTN